MAIRYWVGGAGTWDNSSTAHWSATSGGAAGASVPTATDDVVFDSNSGSGVFQVLFRKDNTPKQALNFDCSTFSGFFAAASNTNFEDYIAVHGNFTASATNTNQFPLTTRSVHLQFVGGAGVTQTITPNGNTLNIVLFWGTPTTTYSITGALTSRNYVQLQAGNFYAGTNVSCLVFATLGTDAKYISMGSNTWTLTGVGDVFGSAVATNVTVDGANATVNITGTTGANKNIYLNGGTIGTLAFTGVNGANGAWVIYGGGTITTLNSAKQANWYLQLEINKTLNIDNFLVSGSYNNSDFSGTLVNTINSTQTTGIITTNTNVNFPTGSYNAKIGNEIFTYTSATLTASGYEFNGVVRGANATSHTAGDTVYIPFYITLMSTTMGTKTNIITKGQFFVGANSVNLGNNTGVVFTDGGALNYLKVQDITVSNLTQGSFFAIL